MPRPETCLRSPSDGFKRCSRCERDFSPAVEYCSHCELPPPPDIEDSLPGERRPLVEWEMDEYEFCFTESEYDGGLGDPDAPCRGGRRR